MYRTKNGSSFDLGVNSGIKRPGIQVVNPFRAYVSANSIAQGNPTIRPDHWFNVRLTSNIVLCSGLDLGSEITFTREFDNITQITEMDGTNGISTTQWQNAYDLTWFGFDVSLYYYGLSWLRAYVDGCFSYQETTSDSRYSLPREYHASSFAMADLRFFFDRRRTFTGYLTAMYTGRDKTVTGTLEDRFFMNCGVACSLLKNKAEPEAGREQHPCERRQGHKPLQRRHVHAFQQQLLAAVGHAWPVIQLRKGHKGEAEEAQQQRHRAQVLT